MQNFKIEGLPMPVNDKDASNKIYVDTLTEDRRRKLEANNPFTFQNGEYTAKGKLNLRGFKIENVDNPENPKDAVNLEYFKTNTTHAFLRKNGGFEAQEHIYLKNKKLGGLRDPIADREAANKKYVDDEIEKIKEYVDEKTEEIKAAGGGGGAPGNVDAAALNVVKTELEKNQAFNTRNQKTFNARGNINMKQKTIRNIQDPTDDTDVVNKEYVDEQDEIIKTEIEELKKVNGGNFGDMKGKKLINVGDPVNPEDASNKKYVDDKTPFTKVNGGYVSSSELDMGNKKIKKLSLPVDFDDAANKDYVDERFKNVDFGLIRRNGGFLAMDAIDMNSNRIKNVASPQIYDDAANKQYVDDGIKKVDDKAENNKNGLEELRAFHVGETTQNKNMRGFKIVNLGNPEDEQDAANKNYVDNEIKNYVDNEIKNIDQAFLKENGYYIARDGINMGYKNIKNLAEPKEESDAAPKSYIDKTLNRINKILTFLNEEDFFNQINDLLKNNPFSRKGDGTLKLPAPLDLQRKRLFNGQPPKDQKDLVIKSYVDDNFLSRDKENSIKENVYSILRDDIEKMLSFSSFFIHGEAEGPIIGMDKIQNSNFRAPHFSPGNPVAADDNRNIMKLTPVFFGKYDGGVNNYNNLTEEELKNAPIVVLPFEGAIVNVSVYGKKKDVLREGEETLKMKLITKSMKYNVAQEQIYTFYLFGKDREREDIHCVDRRPFLTYKYCSSLIVRFESSHENIERIFITIGVQMYNEHFDVYHRKVLPWA